MTNFIGGTGAKSTKKRPTPATALRVQTSINGAPRPFGYGQARLAGNLIWYGNFYADYVPASSGGGKGGGPGGGGKSGAGGGTYYYSTGLAFGLSEGPIDSVQQVWQNKSPLTNGLAAFTLFDGDYQQSEWTFLRSYQPAAAQNFRGLAYAADNSMALGTSSDLPNLTWDVRFAISGALQETGTIPGTPYQLTAASFDWDYGVVLHWMIPNAAPFEYYDAGNLPGSGLALAINATVAGWRHSNSSGVIWDIGATNGTPGQPLTRVGGAPASSGQYQVDSNANYQFYSGDAGQPVVIIDAAVSPGVYFTENVTANLAAGSAVITSISAPAAVAVGDRVSAPGFLVEGCFVALLTGGSATGNAATSNTTLSNVSGNFTATAGTPITDSAGVLPPGTTVLSATPPSVTVSTQSALTVTGVSFNSVTTIAGTLADNQLTGLASTAGIALGASVADWGNILGPLGAAATVIGIAGSTVTIDVSTGLHVTSDMFIFTGQFTGDVTAGSAVIANPSTLAPVATTSLLTDSAGAFTPAISLSAVTQGSIQVSGTGPSGNATGDVFSFAAQATLSQPALKSGTGVSITVRGAPLTQVLSGPVTGEYSLSVQAAAFGQYTFAAADSGKTVLIMDAPDANPADVLADFLTNPYYGMTQFPAARIGDLSAYRNYCLATGLLVSQTITTQAQANQFIADLMKATNSEIVWSGSTFTVVPYGDTAITANGATFTPNLTPLYALTDEDFLPNQGTNSSSVASVATDDPVTVTRLDPYDQDNDITVEYLDRANLYNPAIVEAKDDASIALLGVKNSGTKQLHLFCRQNAALASAQLMLGRTNVHRTFSLTVGREFILLDPMDVIEITDSNAGLVSQLVRITEITENDDRSLSITAEEVLEGTGAAPIYGHQTGTGYVPTYNLAAPNALTPVFFDAPVQIGNVLAMETIIATNGSGPNWGGCEVWLSSDNVTFAYADTLWGGTTMGTLSANFASGADPDTVNTLAVDLTESRGILLGGTQADADRGNTLCLVDQELVTYEQATLTAQYKYNLGKNGSAAGYLRRGVYGTAIASHSTGAPFVRLRQGSYLTIGYGGSDVGTTVHVKLLSFNPWGGGKQTLDEVSSYAHTLAAPPAVSTGLLAGLIQTPDIALNAATAQLSVSAAGPIALPVSPANATMVSGTLTTEGNLVQIAYNAQFTNSGASAETAVWRVTYQGVTVLDSASITIQPGVTATIAKQTTFSAPSQSGVFAMIAQGQAAGDTNLAATYVDLSVTELRR